jgi:hypothetical protein
MDVLARIPDLSRPRRIAAPEATGTAVEPPPAPPTTRHLSLPRPPWRWPRIETGSIAVLAVVSVVIWSLVAWRERQDARDARAAVRLARQYETTPAPERAR